jgi:hypothetical protein
LNTKILLSSVVFIISIQANASRDEFEPVFKRPPPAIHSFTKVAAGAFSLLSGDYLWTEETTISPQRLGAEGFMMLGHTLIIDGVMGLCHWGYDRYMQTFHQNSHQKTHISRTKYTQQPRTEKEEQADDLRWNKIQTIGQSLSNVFSNAVATRIFLSASYTVLTLDTSTLYDDLGTTPYLTAAKIILPPLGVAVSASLTAYHARRTYKAYYTKEYIPGEPPLITLLSSINQSTTASYIKESFGLTNAIYRTIDPSNCPKTPGTIIEYWGPNSKTLTSQLNQQLIPLVDYYYQCLVPVRGTMAATNFGELVGFYGEFKALSSLLQMLRNGFEGIAIRPQIAVKEVLLSTEGSSRRKKPTKPHKNLREIQSNRSMTTESSYSSSHSHFITEGIRETTSPRPYFLSKPEKKKRHGIANLGAGHTNATSDHIQNDPEIHDEDPKRTQGLKAVADYRNFNSVKIKHINTLLREACNFVQGETKPVKGQGSWHALIFNHGSQRIKIKYEIPHSADNGVYKGFKLKRVLNTIETAYMYGWNETGIRAYLDAHGMASFYTVPNHLIHILWRAPDL